MERGFLSDPGGNELITFARLKTIWRRWDGSQVPKTALIKSKEFTLNIPIITYRLPGS